MNINFSTKDPFAADAQKCYLDPSQPVLLACAKSWATSPLWTLTFKVELHSLVGTEWNLVWVMPSLSQCVWFLFHWWQAAIGSKALDMAREIQDETLQIYGLDVLTLAVLAILTTAPVGALGIGLAGPRLLVRQVDGQSLYKHIHFLCIENDSWYGICRVLYLLMNNILM